MQHKRKLLYIYKYCNMGGVASVIKQRFCRMSHEFDLTCAFLRNAGTGTDEWLRQGIKAHILGNNFQTKLQNLIRTVGFDAITVFDTPEAMPVIKEIYDGPLFYEVHTSIFDNIRIGQEIYDSNQMIVVPSQWSKDMMIEHFDCKSDQVQVVPNFVDESLFQFHPQPRRSDHEKLILWVGKFDKNKNWVDALDIFDRVCASDPHVQIEMMTGGGQPMETQQEYIESIISHNLLGRIDIRHHVPYGDMHKFYSAAAQSGGVLLSTSLNESFCMVVHEAWRCRLPVVVGEVGPLIKTVVDGVNGLKFATRDVDTAVLKIRQILDSPQLHAKLVQGGLETASQYDADRHMPHYIALIKDMISRHPVTI